MVSSCGGYTCRNLQTRYTCKWEGGEGGETGGTKHKLLEFIFQKIYSKCFDFEGHLCVQGWHSW